jgi:hypothetical protein
MTHTVSNCTAAISDMFGDRVISEGLWPACSPDLMSCEFICEIASKIKCTKEIPTHYTNFKKIFGKKYSGFPQQSCNV